MTSDDWLTTVVRRVARVVRWTLLVGVALCVVMFAVGYGKIGVSAFPVKVWVRSASSATIVKARAFTASDEERARWIASHPRRKIESPRSEDEEFDGKSLSITVWGISETYCFDLFNSVSWQRYLVVIVEYRDGTRAATVVEIPYQAEAVTAELP